MLLIPNEMLPKISNWLDVNEGQLGPQYFLLLHTTSLTKGKKKHVFLARLAASALFTFLLHNLINQNDYQTTAWW